MKKDLLDLLREVEEKSEKLRDLFEDSTYLDREISTIWDLIDEKYNLPSDDDDLTFLISDYGTRKISKKKFLQKIKKYHETTQNN